MPNLKYYRNGSIDLKKDLWGNVACKTCNGVRVIPMFIVG